MLKLFRRIECKSNRQPSVLLGGGPTLLPSNLYVPSPAATVSVADFGLSHEKWAYIHDPLRY